jgi:hypothetical protein
MTEALDADAVITAETWSDGFDLVAPDRVRVRTLDRLQGVTPEMLDWWFAHMDRDGYMAFHPVDHEEFAWVRGKQGERYVGATHLTHQRYGGTGPLMRAEISFLPPEGAFDLALAADRGAGFTLFAEVRMLDEDGRPAPAPAGQFVHVGLARDGATELRNCWWLRYDESSDLERMTTARFRHVHEEFGHLADFLPGLHARQA